MPVEVKNHVELDLSKFRDELHEIFSLSTRFIPDPGFFYRRQPLDHRLIALSEKEMDLGIRVMLFDSTGKMARKDGIPNESRLDDENCFRRGVSHALRLTHYYGKDHGDNPDIQRRS